MRIGGTVPSAQDALTAQGRRTRAALVGAAEVVFSRRGYARTRIGDITAQAKVSVGTFYGYFASKEAIFVEMVAEYGDRLRAQLDEPHDDEPLAAIRALNERCLEIFRRDAALWAVFEEAALSRQELRPGVGDCRRELVAAARSTVEHVRGSTLVDSRVAAVALTAMTEQSAAQWFAGEEHQLTDAARRLSDMWARMLGVDAGREDP